LGGALYLDGNGSYVTFVGTGVPSGNQSFTIEAWINPTSIPAGGENGGQITFWGNQSQNQANGFRLRGPSGVRHYFWSNDHDENFGINILPDTTGPNGDGWHHLAITYDGVQTVWYWNGVRLGSPRTTAPGVNVQPVNHRIGCRLNAEFFHGFIDEVRIWNKAKSAAEIAADMNQSLSGAESNLVVYFDFEGDLGDRAGGDNNGTFLGNATIDPLVNAPIQTAAPRIFSFTASTNWVMVGTPVTLSWQVTNATWLWIEPGVGAVTGATNSVQVVPETTTTYTLSATNPFGMRIARVTITVDPGIPMAHPQTVATIKNTPVAITLTGSDPNGGVLTFQVVTWPRFGQLTGSPPNLIYTPTNDYFGNDFFTFKVNDGTYDSPAATVSIRIEPEPTPPTAIVLSSTNINSMAGPGQFLAALRAVDANPLDTHTFALVPGEGDTHNGLFLVSSNLLLAGPDYAAAAGTRLFIRLRATDPTGLSYEQAVVLSVVEIQQNVVINEIHYNGPDNTVHDEFIELYNPRPVAVDLSFWRLQGGVDFVFPAGTSIPAGGFLVVAQEPGVILTNYGVAALGPWAGQLNNEGERVTLRGPHDELIDEVEFRSEFPWPIAANGQGGSMELINPALDNNLGSSWATPLNPPRPSPGRTNQVFAFNAAPNIRQVNHTPKQPTSTNAVVITAKVTDPEGVASVVLSYQVVLPGQFIPATLPLTTAQLNSLNTNPGLTNPINPAFEAPTNWITLTMHDDGLDGDAAAGDNIYTVVLPPQANRTLVRYRITVTDTFGASRRAPFEDDPSLNFAYFVYDGIPPYLGYSPAVLQTLPVYWLITRDADLAQCTAWFNTADQLPQDIGGMRNAGRLHFNWEGAIVYNGEVYDHVKYRLRGANGRYHPGKRSFRIRFNRGRYLQAHDEFGNPFPKKWQELTTGKGQSNRGTESFALNEVINYFLWNKVGVPAPAAFFFHFRVVRGSSETNRYDGDFWGLNWAQEEYDVGFLEAHNLPKGNLYKLVDNYVLGRGELRYQGPWAVTNAADFYNIENNLTGYQPTAWLLAHVNYSNWFRYHAVAEAIRHYDVWPSCNKNAAWYFEPIYTPANNYLGRMWLLPYDSTDTWGPTWNGGQDVLHNGIFNDAGVAGGDAGENPELQLEYRNVVRELRDLLFQPDQIYPLIDAFAARIKDFVPADMARWLDAPAPANYRSLYIPTCPGVTGGLPAYVQDMKNFMFLGGNNAWWVDRQSVGTGGWITRLDQLATDPAIPNKPTIRYRGLNGFPLNGLVFESSPFSDPQGSNTFGAMKWRVAEVLDTNQPPSDPRQVPPLEWDAVWESPELTTFTPQVTIPGAYLQPFKLYRVRVRHKDNTGRWSQWSDPFPFYPTPADVIGDLPRSLVISEIMYNPPNEGLINGDDLEFLELKNIGSSVLDLSGLYFSEGISFTFTNGSQLAPGQVLVLVRNPSYFQLKYPGVPIYGVYGGRLDNAGERVTLRHPQGVDIVSISYNDRPPWPVTADGYGFSLALADPATGTYRPSSQPGGSPGADDPPPTTPPVLINEVLAASQTPALDQIELFNPNPFPVDVSGWFLSDDPRLPYKYRIPAGTVIPAEGYLVFDETQFNPQPGSSNSFALNALGDDLYLFAADAEGRLTGYVSGVDFGGSEPGVSLGRHLTSDGRTRFVAQAAPSFGAPNAGPRISPVVITEIMYHPPVGMDEARAEYIEIFNWTDTAVPLFDPAAPTNTWMLKGGVDLIFPTNLTLAPGQFALLVNFDPSDAEARTAFQTTYGLGEDVLLLGPYAGRLNNAGEDVELQQRILLHETNVAAVLMDKVDYRDQAPWPLGADGFGLSLQKLAPNVYGDDPAHWVAAPPTPGRPTTTGGSAPSILMGPTNVVVALGRPASFSVAAMGPGPLSYQWLLNGTNLPGATNPVLTVSAAGHRDIGTYQVLVFNRYGSVASAPARLEVRTPAFILQQPRDVTVRVKPDPAAAPTTNATFSVEAYSSYPIRIQWRFNGVDIPGATNATLVISNVQPQHWGQYVAAISDEVDTVLSQPAWLYPLVRAGFAQSPLSQTVAPNSVVTLSAIATGWPPPFTFEWRLGTTPLLTNEQESPVSFFTFRAPSSPGTVQYRAVLRSRSTSAVGSSYATITVVADSDGDGLPDDWELAYGLNPADPADARSDADSDGAANYDEYVAGSNPTNPASYLKLEIERTNGLVLKFGAVSNRTYSVQWSPALGAPWSKLADIPALATNFEACLTHRPEPVGPTNLFYRVVTPRQP